MNKIVQKHIFRIIIAILFTGAIPISDGNSFRLNAMKAEINKKFSQSQKPTKKDKKKATSYYKRGIKKAKKKDYKGALKDFEKSYKLYPNKKVKSKIDKINSILKKKKKPEKIKKPTKKEKKKAVSYYKRGLKKTKERDYVGALGDFKKSYKLHPTEELKTKIYKVETVILPIIKFREQEPTSQKSKKEEKRVSPQPSKIVEKTKETSVFPPTEKQNLTNLAGEIQDITESLKSTSRQLKFVSQNLNSSGIRLDQDLKKIENRVKKEPENTKLQRELGLLYEESHKSEKAKDIYLKLIQKDPSNPDFHFYLGSFYANSGDLEQARYLFEEALLLQPGHEPTLEAMYSFLGSGKSDKMGREILQESIQKNPEGSIQQLTLIREKIENKQYAKAILQAKSGLMDYPNNSEFFYLKGVSEEKNGEIDHAKLSYQSAIRIIPGNQKYHLALANLFFEKGQYLYSALSFSDVVRLVPDDIDSRYMQGLSYFNSGEWNRAVSAWENLLHYQSEHTLVKNLLPQAYYILAIEYNRTGLYSKSRTSFDNAMSINVTTNAWLPQSMEILGKYYREKSMYTESLNAYKEAIELRPKDSEAYLGLGITYWKMGESIMATGSWKKSLQLKPDNYEAKGWLILAQQGL